MSLHSVDPLTGLDRSTTERLAAEDAAARAPAQRIGPHHCHAVGCTQVVPPEMLMCREHWFRVPAGIRKRVLFWYTAGQCHDTRKIKPEWIAAAREAIAAVLKFDLPRLVRRVEENLPADYDRTAMKVERIGMAVMLIRQEGKPDLIGHLGTGEVREAPMPAPPDRGDAGDAHPDHEPQKETPCSTTS